MDDLEIIQSEHTSGHNDDKEEHGEDRRAVPSPTHSHFTECGWRGNGLIGIKRVGFFLEPVIPEIQFRHDCFLLLL
jgi:hypothetical protein